MPKLKIANPDCTEVRRVYFENTDNFGYGVFATRDIKKNEMIEEGTYFLTGFFNTKEDAEHIRGLPQYCWTMKCGCDQCKDKNELQYIVTTGNTMLYNHSEDFNAVVSIVRSERIVRIYARRDITKDEELFANYGKGYNFWYQSRH